MKPLRVFFLGILLIFSGIDNTVQAQCAMCRATVESNLDGEKTVGKGLNNGILYLMTVPYLVLAGFGYMIYKNRKGRV
jgi:hypothetical protein